jgi:hypothetical protein
MLIHLLIISGCFCRIECLKQRPCCKTGLVGKPENVYYLDFYGKSMAIPAVPSYPSLFLHDIYLILVVHD